MKKYLKELWQKLRNKKWDKNKMIAIACGLVGVVATVSITSVSLFGFGGNKNSEATSVESAKETSSNEVADAKGNDVADESSEETTTNKDNEASVETETDENGENIVGIETDENGETIAEIETDENGKPLAEEETTEEIPDESVVTGYTNLGISNANEYLNVRSGPGLDYKIIGKMPGYCACEILEEDGGWYKIISGDVEGYVYAELMVTGKEANVIALEYMEEMLVVTTDILNVREEPNTNCTIYMQVATGEQLEILEDEVNGWYKININNIVGYVSGEFVEKRNVLPTAVVVKQVVATTTTTVTPSVDTSQLSNEVSQTAVDLIDYAMQFLGNPYVAGGYSLTTGTDCSGFVKLIFEHFGYDLPRSSSDYLYTGTQIPLSALKPGDLILYKYGSSIGHVAIYIGNNQIIHASTPRTGIVIGNAYYTTPYCAVRIIP